MKKIAGILNVRMGSSRLPGKTLKKIEGQPTVQILINRVMRSKFLDNVIINTTTNSEDDQIVEYCIQKGIQFNRGSEYDVLSRICDAIKKFEIDEFVELYGDAILQDPSIVDKAAHIYFSDDNHDFVGNDLKTTYPTGFEVEVVRSTAMIEANRLCEDPSIREHGTLFVRLNPHIFRLHNFEFSNPYDFLPELTLDTEKDFELIKTIIKRLGGTDAEFSLSDILAFLDRNRDLMEINLGTERRWRIYRQDS